MYSPGGGRKFVRPLVRLLGRDLEKIDPPPVHYSEVGVLPAASIIYHLSSIYIVSAAVVGRHHPKNQKFEAVRLKVVLVAMLLTRCLRQAHHHHYYSSHSS